MEVKFLADTSETLVFQRGAFGVRGWKSVAWGLIALASVTHADEVYDLCKDHRGSGKTITLGEINVTMTPSIRYPEGCKVRNEQTGAEIHCTKFGILKQSESVAAFECQQPGAHVLVRSNLEPFTMMERPCFEYKIYEFEGRTWIGCRVRPQEFHFYNLKGELALPATCLPELKPMPNGTVVCFKATGDAEIPVYKSNGMRMGGESEDICKLIPDSFNHVVSEIVELNLSGQVYLFWKQKRVVDGIEKSECFGNDLNGAKPKSPHENHESCDQIRIDGHTARCYRASGTNDWVQIDAVPINARELVDVRFF